MCPGVLIGGVITDTGARGEGGGSAYRYNVSVTINGSTATVSPGDSGIVMGPGVITDGVITDTGVRGGGGADTLLLKQGGPLS